jgi:hypothetical protein
VVDPGKHHIANKGKNGRIGVEWTQAPKAQPGHLQIQEGKIQLECDQQANDHSDESPEDSSHRKEPYMMIVIFDDGSGALGRTHNAGVFWNL